MNETIDSLSKLPPVTWFLVAGAVVFGWALSWVWRWYRRRRAHKALVAAVTASASDNLRDVRGNIFGGDQMTEWTVIDGPQRFTFTNPQVALYDRIAAVRAVAGDVPTEGRIVFTKRGKFPKGLPKWTLMVESLRTEFPSAESLLLDSTVERFDASWQRLKSAAMPSSINQIRVGTAHRTS